MKITLEKVEVLTEEENVEIDIAGSDEQVVWVKTATGQFKVTSDGYVIFFGRNSFGSGEIIHKNGGRA